MGSATITDTYRRDARMYSGLDVSTPAPGSSGATFPFTSCRIASSISGSGVELVLSGWDREADSAVAEAPAVFERAVAAAAAADALFDVAATAAVLRVRVAVVLAGAGLALASAFFAEAAAPADLVDAARVVFFTAGEGASAAPVSAAVTSDFFFLGVLAGVAPAVLFVLSFLFGTLAAAAVVLLAALAGFAAVDASRNGAAGVHAGILLTHREHRPKSCGLRTREDIGADRGLDSAWTVWTLAAVENVVDHRIWDCAGTTAGGSRCRKGIVNRIYTCMLEVE